MGIQHLDLNSEKAARNYQRTTVCRSWISFLSCLLSLGFKGPKATTLLGWYDLHHALSCGSKNYQINAHNLKQCGCQCVPLTEC
jgi:hypothetical protein